MADESSDHTSAVSGGNGFGVADDNVIQSFRLESSALRGRAVRLGRVLNDILDDHDYPEPVAHLVGETITLTLLLSSMLQYDGIFTVQTSGDGPISMLVADVTSTGDLRGCAHYDPERLQKAREQLEALKTPESSQNHLAQYLGKGYIAFTVDLHGQSDRHQGIVELKGASLIDCVQHYFNQSEKIGTGIKMSVGRREGVWRAGGMMLEHMPEESLKKGNTDEDDWRRAMILMDTTTDDEFLNPDLHSNALLMRLFHEEGVRVFDPIQVQNTCRCDQMRVENILMTMSDEDLEYMTKGSNIEVKCEFCSKEYVFDLKTIKRKIGAKDNTAQE